MGAGLQWQMRGDFITEYTTSDSLISCSWPEVIFWPENSFQTDVSSPNLFLLVIPDSNIKTLKTLVD